MKKTTVLKVRLSPPEKQQLKNAAVQSNKTMSEIVRSKIAELKND
jgi:predicted DNA-binding protein